MQFLDPFTKSSVFLREITSRLTLGLAQDIPELQERVNHILTKQVFGIGITHLTSLLARRSVYYSKYANGAHSIATSFASDAGNIWFERTEHTWAHGKCSFCGASQAAMDRGEALETHAYAFVHTDKIKTWMTELFGDDMQIGVIVDKPPFQLNGGGYGSSGAPIYQLFAEKAFDLATHYAVFVTPSRWMAGELDSINEDLTVLSNPETDFLPITTRAYLYPSGTPFKALATGEFIEEQIFNWTYTDEQRAKAAFAAMHPAKRSPCVALPLCRRCGCSPTILRSAAFVPLISIAWQNA